MFIGLIGFTGQVAGNRYTLPGVKASPVGVNRTIPTIRFQACLSPDDDAVLTSLSDQLTLACKAGTLKVSDVHMTLDEHVEQWGAVLRVQAKKYLFYGRRHRTYNDFLTRLVDSSSNPADSWSLQCPSEQLRVTIPGYTVPIQVEYSDSTESKIEYSSNDKKFDKKIRELCKQLLNQCIDALSRSHARRKEMDRLKELEKAGKNAELELKAEHTRQKNAYRDPYEPADPNPRPSAYEEQLNEAILRGRLAAKGIRYLIAQEASEHVEDLVEKPAKPASEPSPMVSLPKKAKQTMTPPPKTSRRYGPDAPMDSERFFP